MSTLGIYVRVSTEEQTSKGISLSDQALRGQEAAAIYGYKNFVVFQDGGLSGSLPIDKRPQLQLMVDEIYNGNIHGIYVTDLVRLSRNVMHSEILKSIIKDNSVKLYDRNGEINLHDVNQELIADIRAIFNAFMLKRTSAQIKLVLERNVIQGKVAGGPLQPYGYAKDNNKLLIVDNKEAEVVIKIYQMALNGKGSQAIALELNNLKIPTKRHNAQSGGNMKVKGVVKDKSAFKWRDKTVLGILKNPMYKGKRLYKSKTYDCPAIISEGMWDAVQDAISHRNKFKDTNNQYKYLLKGLIRCGKCGQGFYGHKRQNNKDCAYICVSKRNRGEGCGTKGVNIDYLDSLVWDCIINVEKDMESFYEDYEKQMGVKNDLHELNIWTQEKQNLEDAMRNMVRLSNMKKLDDTILISEMENVGGELKKVNSFIAHLEKSLKCLAEKNGVIAMVKKHMVMAKKKGLSFEEKQRLIRTFVNWIDIRWDEALRQHMIAVDLKIDNLTQYKLANEYIIHYKGKSNWRLKTEKVFQSNISVTTIRDNDVYTPIVSIDDTNDYLPTLNELQFS